ncbi:MAG: ATP-binding cassette domain-containing protein, partial [Bifidobacteriaceae bacterium]|nr:ATP-binding cassette domain-containing protein [Bifidobacteriaceae bacterium]
MVGGPTARERPSLEVNGVSKAFSGVQAVADVSFRVAPGQVVSIIGPNGSGKSTTINLISGLIRPDTGEIAFGGRAVGKGGQVRAAENGIGRTFQNGRVFASLSVADNVQLGLHKTLAKARPWRAASQLPLLRWGHLAAEAVLALAPTPGARAETRAFGAQIDRQLERFGERLRPRRDNLAHTLSYANRRRTEIARALVAAPELLLLDEPTAGMNQSETQEVLGQLRDLKAAGQTMLLVEHKIDLVLSLSDAVIVMDGGRVIAQGPPAAVRRDAAVIAAYLGTPRDRSRTRPAGVPDAVPGAPAPPPDPLGGRRPSPTAQVPAAPLLEIAGADVDYGAVRALAGLSLTVGQGEIVSLLGGNASGKSTTMKTVLGLVSPANGTVR